MEGGWPRPSCRTPNSSNVAGGSVHNNIFISAPCNFHMYYSNMDLTSVHICRCRSWTVSPEGLQSDQTSYSSGGLTSNPVQYWRSGWSNSCLCGAPWTLHNGSRTWTIIAGLINYICIQFHESYFLAQQMSEIVIFNGFHDHFWHGHELRAVKGRLTNKQITCTVIAR